MAKVPSFAKAFAGRSRIVEMDVWDNDFLDLVEEAHLTFKGSADGEIAFGALRASSMSDMAPAMAQPVRNSRGRDMMRTTQPVAAAGLSLALEAASSATSTSTTPTIQAWFAKEPDFFNGLLVLACSKSLKLLTQRCLQSESDRALVGRTAESRRIPDICLIVMHA